MNIQDALDSAEERSPVIAAVLISNDGFFCTWIHGNVATEKQLGYIVEGLTAATSAIGTTGVAGRA